jgi:hypothetical protein
MENVRDIGATSGARYSNATDRQKLGFGWPKPCIRTASLRTGVSVSGKRNFVRRDKGDETSGEVHRDSPAETKLTPQLGQLRASYRTAGKSLRKSECVVGSGGLELPTKRLWEHTEALGSAVERSGEARTPAMTRSGRLIVGHTAALKNLAVLDGKPLTGPHRVVRLEC